MPETRSWYAGDQQTDSLLPSFAQRPRFSKQWLSVDTTDLGRKLRSWLLSACECLDGGAVHMVENPVLRPEHCGKTPAKPGSVADAAVELRGLCGVGSWVRARSYC